MFVSNLPKTEIVELTGMSESWLILHLQPKDSTLASKRRMIYLYTNYNVIKISNHINMRWKDVLNCKTKSLRVVCFKECIGIAVYTTALTLEEWRGRMPSRYVRISRSWSKFKQSHSKAFNFSAFWRIMSTQARDFFKINSWKQPEGCNTQDIWSSFV